MFYTTVKLNIIKTTLSSKSDIENTKKCQNNANGVGGEHFYREMHSFIADDLADNLRSKSDVTSFLHAG